MTDHVIEPVWDVEDDEYSFLNNVCFSHLYLALSFIFYLIGVVVSLQYKLCVKLP